MGKRRGDSRVPDMNPNAHTGDGEYSLNSRQNIAQWQNDTIKWLDLEED